MQEVRRHDKRQGSPACVKREKTTYDCPLNRRLTVIEHPFGVEARECIQRKRKEAITLRSTQVSGQFSKPIAEKRLKERCQFALILHYRAKLRQSAIVEVSAHET